MLEVLTTNTTTTTTTRQTRTLRKYYLYVPYVSERTHGGGKWKVENVETLQQVRASPRDALRERRSPKQVR